MFVRVGWGIFAFDLSLYYDVLHCSGGGAIHNMQRLGL